MKKLGFREKVGLTKPYKLRLQQAKVALFGDEDVPRSSFGLSSLAQLYPRISPKLWRGKFFLDKTVIISNLFNHTQTPIEDGWSVAKTQTLDFRGKGLTYNSHNGTDFSIPTGTKVCAAAAGIVVAIQSEFNRGGLKIYLDHGDGLMTCYAHLARSLVKTGDILQRGQVIALSGYSGLDGFATYPFGIPHIHFNVWLNGEPVDPFPYQDKPSMWRGGTLPKASSLVQEESSTPSTYVERKLEEAIDSCKTASSRNRLNAIIELYPRANHTIIEMNYYPTRFKQRVNFYTKTYEREARLDLPFLEEEFKNVVFIDELT